ncbi:MAG: NAD(P)/FAD-dependent oxidoreductase [Peptococcia bacterium]
MDMYDIVIIGGGPAGLTAGIYACRAGWKTLVIEKGAIGGQAAITDRIENYPRLYGRDLRTGVNEQFLQSGRPFWL